MTYRNFHVANAINSGLNLPAECLPGPLTPQEKILEFMILDLTTLSLGGAQGPPPPPRP